MRVFGRHRETDGVDEEVHGVVGGDERFVVEGGDYASLDGEVGR